MVANWIDSFFFFSGFTFANPAGDSFYVQNRLHWFLFRRSFRWKAGRWKTAKICPMHPSGRDFQPRNSSRSILAKLQHYKTQSWREGTFYTLPHPGIFLSREIAYVLRNGRDLGNWVGHNRRRRPLSYRLQIFRPFYPQSKGSLNYSSALKLCRL